MNILDSENAQGYFYKNSKKGSYIIMLKKFFAAFLIMLFAAAGAWALPGSPYGNCGNNVNWKFEKGTLTISGTGSMDNSRAFNRNDWPWHEYSSGDESEEDWVLFYYARVTKIIVEDGVTEIGHHAFRNFSRLESVTIADSVTSIKDNAFYSCPNLRSISLGNGVKTIEYNVFQGCSALTEITLPGTVEYIGDNVFQGCSSLKTVAFKKPASQHNLEIKNNSNSTNGGIRYDGECALFDGENRIMQGIPINYLSAKTLFFRPYAQIVRDGMCGVNTKWEVSENDHILTLSKYDLGVPIDESIYDYKSAAEVPWYPYNNDLKGVEIKDGITKICNYAFTSNQTIKNIVIPDSVKEIGLAAFNNCKALTEIEIPASVQKVGGEAFKDCVALKTVTFVAPSPVTGNIEFGENAFTNTTAVIRYKGKGMLQNNDEDSCVPAGNLVRDFSSGKFTWFSSSKSFEIKRADGGYATVVPTNTELIVPLELTNKLGLIRDVKWSIDCDFTVLGILPFWGASEAKIIESNDNGAKIRFFVGPTNSKVICLAEVKATCEGYSKTILITLRFDPQKANASVNSVHSAADENAILNGKIGDTLTASFKADPDLIWTLIPDAGTAEHAESIDITLNGDIAEVEAVFDRRGEYNSIVVAKNSSGDIVDVDSLTFTVTDDGNLTLAPEGLYFNATVSEPKDALIRIKSTTNVDGVKWGVFWDEEPTNSAITSNDSGINITAEWDTPGEYHALVTADSKEGFDYTILTFSVAKTNIFELLLDKVFFNSTLDGEFNDVSVLISGDVKTTDIEWTLNFDGKVISEEELKFLYNDEGVSASPVFSTEGEHQIQIIANKGDCIRSVTLTFITGEETAPIDTMSNIGSEGSSCNTGLGILTLLMSVIMVLMKKS